MVMSALYCPSGRPAVSIPTWYQLLTPSLCSWNRKGAVVNGSSSNAVSGQDDELQGGTGDDELVGDEDIFGSANGDGTPAGDDDLDGGTGNDYMTGGDGEDILSGGNGAGRDQMWGGPLTDQMTGGNGADDMDGGPGDDLMFGGNGNDYMVGGPGDDRLEGGNGNDLLFGGEGDDTLISSGDSYVDGGPGNDVCHVVLDTDIFVSCETIIEVVLSDPSIALIGANPLDVVIGFETYAEPGATCNDPQDGPTAVTDITGVVDSLTLGPYVVTYKCVDLNGNIAPTVTRDVNVILGQTPVLTLNGEPIVNIVTGTLPFYLELSADCNDLEEELIATVIGGETVIDVVDTYDITYDCTDLSGNVAQQITRTVNIIVDDQTPVLTLIGSTPLNLVLNVDTPYAEPGATCIDPQEGDITLTKLVIGGAAVPNAIGGPHVITYDCADGVGNNAPQITRDVFVIAGQTPVLTLNGGDPITIVIGVDTYNEQSAVCNDAEDGVIATVITGDVVDDLTAFTYVVDYDCTDSSGNNASPISRTVNVIPAPIVDLTEMSIIINTLVADDLMKQKDANQILKPLDQAQNKFDDGDTAGACTSMGQFDDKLNRAIDKDNIPIAAGVGLLNDSSAVQAANCS